MRPLHWILACVLAACGTPPAPNDATQLAPTAMQLVPGQVHVYRFAWIADSEGRGPAILPESLPVTGGLRLEGTAAVRSYGDVDEGTLLGVSFVELDDAAVTVWGQNVITEPGALLGHEAFLVVSTDGSTRDAYFRPDAPPLFVELMEGFLAHVDVTATTRAGLVPTGHGLAHARYERRGAHVTRELTDYVRLDDVVGGDAAAVPRVEGRSDVELDEAGVPTRLEARELLTVASPGEEPRLRADTRFVLERVRIDDAGASARPTLDELVRRDLMAPPDNDEAARVLAQRFADGITSFDVWIGIRSLGNGLLPERGFVVRAVGLLRGWPDEAEQMIETFDAVDDERARSLVLDLLASADTPQAESVMRRLLARDDVRRLPYYPGLLQRFAFLRRPSAASAGFLIEAHGHARDSELPAARAAVLAPMGAMAAAIEREDPVAAELLLRTIRIELDHAGDPQLRVGALTGLANAGRAEDRPRIFAHVGTDDLAVRGAAATALGPQRDAVATEVLLHLLDDEEAFVARQALAALEPRLEEDAVVVQRVVGIVAAGRYHPHVAAALGEAINEHALEPSLRRRALRAIRDRSTDPRERRLFDRWLRRA